MNGIQKIIITVKPDDVLKVITEKIEENFKIPEKKEIEITDIIYKNSAEEIQICIAITDPRLPF